MLRGCDPGQTFEFRPPDGGGIVLHCRFIRAMERWELGERVDAFILAQTEPDLRRALGDALRFVITAAENVPGHEGSCGPEALVDLLTAHQVTAWIGGIVTAQGVSESMMGKSESARLGAAAPSAESVAPVGA